MANAETLPKRRWGDRRDGRRVKAPGLQTVMGYLLPKRTDCEVYLNDTIDATELMKYLEAKNAAHPEYKTTLFHCAVTGMARMVRERPLMNRFIQGYRNVSCKIHNKSLCVVVMPFPVRADKKRWPVSRPSLKNITDHSSICSMPVSMITRTCSSARE